MTTTSAFLFNQPFLSGQWLVYDAGALSAAEHMRVDSQALKLISDGFNRLPIVRFFDWTEPAVTFGYLLDPAKAKHWAEENHVSTAVQRPTGGGAVLHQTNDVSLSLVWPRSLKLLPHHPRTCYGLLHEALKSGVEDYLEEKTARLFVKEQGSCQAVPTMATASPGKSNRTLPVCFEEPVCFDVMLNDQKIIGGAFRVTRKAMLYQGHIQLPLGVNKQRLKTALWNSLENLLNPAGGVFLPTSHSGEVRRGN